MTRKPSAWLIPVAWSALLILAIALPPTSHAWPRGIHVRRSHIAYHSHYVPRFGYSYYSYYGNAPYVGPLVYAPYQPTNLYLKVKVAPRREQPAPPPVIQPKIYEFPRPEKPEPAAPEPTDDSPTDVLPAPERDA